MTSGKVKCDGNHGGPRCGDPECWNDEGGTFVYQGNFAMKEAVKRLKEVHGIDSQEAGDGVGGEAGPTDNPDTKNMRGDWFNPFGGDRMMASMERDLAESARVNMRLVELVEASQEEVERLRHEIALLKLAARCAGDEIRDRKPEPAGQYLLTWPECSTSPGMYVASAVLLGVIGTLLAWWWA